VTASPSFNCLLVPFLGVTAFDAALLNELALVLNETLNSLEAEE
jgi:hypothetical protein